MFHFDGKLILVGALFLALMVVKLLARRPYDTPVRRRRRFGYRGTMSPLRDPEAPASAPPPDPEREFFEGAGGNGGNEAHEPAPGPEGKRGRSSTPA